MMNEEQDIHKQPSSPDMLNSDSLDTDKDDDSLASELTDEEKSRMSCWQNGSYAS